MSESAGDLLNVVTLLGAAVVAVPLFKRLGLGSVLGYLAAGLAIGPFGFGLFNDAQTILLTAIGMAFGFSLAISFICGMGFVLTSTAIVMQLLGERGDIASPRGQKIVAVLLFEDLMIVPLLALVAFIAPAGSSAPVSGSAWGGIAIAAGALAAMVAAGIWLLNPLFRILAHAKAREVMTAAALLVVLGAALLMQLGGLSMAMGAFLAGVLLSESTFRHQLEADIEPFRGLLLGLFFLGVGMSLDLAVVARNWPLIVSGVLAMMFIKGLCIYCVARLTKSSHGDALDRAVLMAQGGEFAFVLFAAALANQALPAETNASMTAVVVLSMALTPLAVLIHQRLRASSDASLDGTEQPTGLTNSVLIVGFGRFGQIVSQHVLAMGADIAIIDREPQVARDAQDFGFKVYYGDGARMDVLHAAGAGHARAILVCIDDPQAATQIVEHAKTHFPQARVLARAHDREHAIALIKANVDYQIRVTLESAMSFGHEAMLALGSDPETAADLMAELRRKDAERLAMEVSGGIYAGTSMILGNAPTKAKKE